jgi:hypothetical protein
MAFSKSTLTLMKWLYWVILSAIHLFIVYILISSGRPIAGILWLVLGFLLIYIMYPVYFPPGDPGSQWPPYITACPDYLTMIAPNSCVDYVGLGSPVLKKSDPTNPPSLSDSQNIFNSSGSVAQKQARAQQYGLSWDGIN